MVRTVTDDSFDPQVNPAALKRLKGIVTLCGALCRNAKAGLAEILEYALDLVAKLMSRYRFAPIAIASSMTIAALSAGMAHADDDFLKQAKEFTALATAPSGPWTGPTTGPKAAPGKFVIYVSVDQRTASVSAVGEGVEEAAKIIGWKYRLIDGNGTIAGVSSALSQAIALKPDGIVLGGVDVSPYVDLLQQAAKQGIKVDGWHIGPVPGPIADPPVVYNVNTAPPEVGKASALYAVADFERHGGRGDLHRQHLSDGDRQIG